MKFKYTYTKEKQAKIDDLICALKKDHNISALCQRCADKLTVTLGVSETKKEKIDHIKKEFERLL